MTKETINAFHPDYMKTHEPNFWGTALAGASRSQTMSNIVTATRLKNPSHGTLLGISPKITPVSLKPLDFMVYSKAGVANVKPKKRKKK